MGLLIVMGVFKAPTFDICFGHYETRWGGLCSFSLAIYMTRRRLIDINTCLYFENNLELNPNITDPIANIRRFLDIFWMRVDHNGYRAASVLSTSKWCCANPGTRE